MVESYSEKRKKKGEKEKKEKKEEGKKIRVFEVEGGDRIRTNVGDSSPQSKPSTDRGKVLSRIESSYLPSKTLLIHSTCLTQVLSNNLLLKPVVYLPYFV